MVRCSLISFLITLLMVSIQNVLGAQNSDNDNKWRTSPEDNVVQRRIYEVLGTRGKRSPYGEPPNPLVEVCKKMQFLEHEYTKPILGNCSLCQRGSGTYRYVQGCNRIDCDVFESIDPYAPYPSCCPRCKGFAFDPENYIRPRTDLGPMPNDVNRDKDGARFFPKRQDDRLKPRLTPRLYPKAHPI